MSRHAPVYGPFVLAPPLTSCESAFLVFGQGTPPYSIAVAGTADANFTALETLPTQARAGVVEWHVDFDAGANLTFVLTDGQGQHAYSPYRVVQPGTVSTCPRGQPIKSSANHAGPIAGGIIGALVLALVVLTSLWYVRRARRRVAMQAAAERDAYYAAAHHIAINAASKDNDDDDDDNTPLGGEGAASVVRAGTFNLGAVRFTEDSLDHLRAIDRPPAYDRPPPPPPVPADLPGLSSASSSSAAAAAASHRAAAPAPPSSPPPPASPPLPNRADDEIRELPRP